MEKRNLKFETLQLHVGQEKPYSATDARCGTYNLFTNTFIW